MTAGRVTVNGVVVTELGTRVDPLTDIVAVDGKPVDYPHEPTTLMLNKPAGYITTMSDPYDRPCVVSLVPIDEYPGLFPIGRLDTDTTGLLLFSTDGELGNRLMHPRHHVIKTYRAWVDGRAEDNDLDILRDGVMLDDGLSLPAELSILDRSSKKTEIQIKIREGRKRQVRRMFDAIGYPVISLKRMCVGPLCLENLEEGHWRILSDEETASLWEYAE